MRKCLWSLALCLWAGGAWAQQGVTLPQAIMNQPTKTVLQTGDYGVFARSGASPLKSYKFDLSTLIAAQMPLLPSGTLTSCVGLDVSNNPVLGSCAAGGGITQLTSDVTAGPGSGSQVATLSNTGVTAATYGDASHVPQIVVNAKGRITSASNVAITIGTNALTGTLLAGQMPVLTGDVTTPGGSFVTTLAATGVSAGTFGDATHVAQVTVDAKGRITGISNVLITAGGGSGTVTQNGNLASNAMVIGGTNGTTDIKTIAAMTDGQLIVGQTGAAPLPKTITGDVGFNAAAAATIAAGAVTNAKMANMPTHTYKGNNTGSPSAPIDLTQTQLTAELNLFTSSLQGLVGPSGGGTANFLRADGVWAAPSGSGSVNTGTATQLAYYATSTNAVSSNSHLTETGSLFTLNYNATALPAPFAGTVFQLGGADASMTRLTMDTFATGGGNGIIGRAARGTNASKTALGSLDQLFALSGFGYGSTGYSAALRAQIACVSAEVWTDTAQGTKCGIVTTAKTTTTTTNKLSIEDDGGIIISTDTNGSPPTGGSKGPGTINLATALGSPAIFQQGTPLLGEGFDNGTNPVTVTTTGTVAATTRVENIGTLSASIVRTLPAIGSTGLPAGGKICFDDLGINVTPTHTLTVTANAADSINGGSSGGSIGPWTSLTENCFRVGVTGHNWAQADGVPTSNAPAHNFANGLGVNGLIYGQPDFSDLTGSATVAQEGASPASHAVLVDVAGVPTWKVVPDCPANAVGFTQASDTFGCNTITGGGTTQNWLMAGCQLSYNSTTVINIAACQAIDKTNTTVMTAAAFTKNVSATWASGTGNGALGNGITLANNTWYWVCMVHTTTPVTDYFVDTAIGCTNPPASLTSPIVRPIFPFKTCGAGSLTCSNTASTNIDKFFQAGRKFTWNSAQLDANNVTYNNTPAALTLSVPPGLKVDANTILYVSHAADGFIAIYDADDSANPKDSSGFVSCGGGAIATNPIVNCQVPVTTSTSSGVLVYASSNTLNTANYINTVSYTLPDRAIAAY